MKTSTLIITGTILLIVALSSINNASAVCCFPWEITHHIDPETGFLVISGELWNDSYRQEPFGNTDYRFEFLDEHDNVLFEKNIVLTKEFPIKGGAIIPFNTVFPFQLVIDDVDTDTLQKVNRINFDGTNSLDYFGWKPSDLELRFDNMEKVKPIGAKNSEDIFNLWQINGTITNKHYEKTENVFVVASLHDEEDKFIGVAGYSDKDIQPLTLEGNETKNFVLWVLVPTDRTPMRAILYAESDDTSMIHEFYMPLILKDTTNHKDKRSEGYKKPIPLTADIINTSRENVDFDWIIQIKKSPKRLSEGDVGKYPDSKIEEIKYISSHVDAQNNIQLEYSWIPQSDGIYFYEYFIWSDSVALSFPFKGTFSQDSWMIVDSSTSSLRNQLKSGTPLDSLTCRFEQELVQKVKNGNFVCVKPESIPKLIERGWTIPVPIQPEIGKTGEYSFEIIDGAVFDIQYSIKGANVLSMNSIKEKNSVMINLDSPYEGSLTVSLPRYLIDAKISEEVDDLFFVFVDGIEVPYTEDAGKDVRTLTISFEQGAKIIEILGVIPL